MRYRLRTLLIVLALGPPLIAVAYWLYPDLAVGNSADVFWLGVFVAFAITMTAIKELFLSGKNRSNT